MLPKTTTLRDEESLRRRLLVELSQGVGPAVIQAGHFALTPEMAIAAVAGREAFPEEGIGREFFDFSLDTLGFVAEVASALQPSARLPSLLVLVNDWQFLTKGPMSRRLAEREAARLRAAFFEARPKLLPQHSAILEGAAVKLEVFARSEAAWMFSEADLRHDLVKSIEHLFSDGTAEALGLERGATSTGDPIVSLTNGIGQPAPIVYCGSTNCSGEVMELLRQIFQRDVRLFINIFPDTCFGPVIAGTEIARQIFGLKGLRVVNVAVPLANQVRFPISVTASDF